jgi:hypothetical protein
MGITSRWLRVSTVAGNLVFVKHGQLEGPKEVQSFMVRAGWYLKGGPKNHEYSRNRFSLDD